MRVLITDGMDADAVKKLKNIGWEIVEEFFEHDELANQVKEFDAIVVRSATKIRKDIIDAAAETGRLKLIIRAGVGIDNIDAKYAEEKCISVRNTPDASSNAVAELTIAHMFNVARHMHIANHAMRLGKWDKKNYQGIELNEKTLGLIGFGRIARKTAMKAEALGMKVLYTNISGNKEGSQSCEYCNLEKLLAESDFVSVHIPSLLDGTPLIGKKEFDQMKDGTYIINTARGNVICFDAMLEALDSGKLSGAALDVFPDEPLTDKRIYCHDKISLTPHIGASTIEAQKRIGEEIVKIIQQFFIV